ncbi:Kv channel-interacting protein 1-like [Malaya genurostris]|uniref:Kv channel-interacting protein 1-like n=1 Tax=Malaya genurostris TaxID=325434 RepID=UPI0026F39EFD|nr:Kv channel-interacting protein 1-like [Malaya genurostris]XP_058451439.1 Kv channel-interacting protein 1-like [Malaya genurostris]XP_058451440.1 Kv channel-interacting protein 1-like [Malaya genurostris]XP_058451441.1 Kv channel-interacting protein 1-like [Malaya genurostris]XP_058451442.1 Kv channel-interacting protein 1-like [Malaya genurostris]XP_058451443.1 Kv channel-interacting protein 1-like [Malaya genurostris]
MASLVQPSTATHSQQVVQSQQIAIEISSEPMPAPQQLQIHHQELQAHALLAQCQQPPPSLTPTPSVDIVLRESTRANLISRKKTSVGGDRRGPGGTGSRSSRRDDKDEGKSVYRKFFKRIKTILDGNDPTTKSKPEAEDLPVPQRYYPDSLGELTRTARFTEDEIKRIYRGFKAECPTGIVKEETFKGIYSQFFPLGAASGQYAHYVFNSIDLDRNGSLSFEEFVANLSILLRGTVDEKLQWTFSLYDINGDGCITKEEMKEIVTAIYELMGKVPEGCEEEQAIKEKVERLFEKMDRNCDGKITLDEFIECCTTDESIRRSIAVFDTIF